MTADDKIARPRLSVLELAQTLGNVSEACRQRDMPRPQFYEYKRRFQTHGLASQASHEVLRLGNQDQHPVLNVDKQAVIGLWASPVLATVQSALFAWGL